ncbi:hypothetical protein IDH41_08915 [Paenibacillus sp. IB182493]|uniref:Uncharacterized protein n=2 Tax=Paenibacillus arenilitoris TaxID=2772299 RepID=A0A927H6L7_9BACL|nr:hypothetical protein [Paenibacillus arenilitoris]
MIQWSIAESEAEREEGVKFVCQHGEGLGLLYNWSTVMNSLVYAIEDNGFIIGTDDEGGMAAVLAHTAGTLEDGYKDPGRVEVHLLYFNERHRGGASMLGALRMLVQKLVESQMEVREVVFFAPATDGNRSLFGKLATLTKTTEPPCGVLDFYTIPLGRLLRFDPYQRL